LIQNNFELTITVQPEDIDRANHVNNVVYLKWIQDVSEGHWLAVAPPAILEKYYWVALRHEIDYKSSGYLGEEFLLKTHLKSYGGVRSLRAVQIIRKSDNKVLVESLTTWILMSTATNKPIRIGEELEKLFPLLDS
jgi:acyl-CoA thioester hydrolase